ncbi:type II toxin-antitoxin system RelE/ParE family toxin [Patescibacteria group bacterium]|nr:MAG: type II toxin-antitoxin system RelE/ParE family toxin [Patescibacteria group bacterium]
MHEIVVTPPWRDLRKLTPLVLKRIDRAILALKDPYVGDVKHLKDHQLADWRIRVGDYRILFDIDDARKVVVILRVGHRKDIYC